MIHLADELCSSVGTSYPEGRRFAMQVTYSDKAAQGGEGLALLQQATRRLEEAIGRSTDQVRAEWDRTEDVRGRPLYTLRVAEGAESASTSFAPDDLRESFDLRHRL